MTQELLTIGQVADRLGLATSALRFYERQGLITSTRTDGGQRRYTRDVLRRVAFVMAARAVGLQLNEIADTLATLPAGRVPTRTDWAKLSASWRPRIDAQLAALTNLRTKLDMCIGCGCLSLDTCELFNPADVAANLGPGPRYLLHNDRPTSTT